VRLALGDLDGAIEDQTLSIALAPEEADPHLNRGTAEEALARLVSCCCRLSLDP
jgi:hypothetical protein